jgi:hypothetical protein
MSEYAARAFDALGSIVDGVGRQAVGQLLDIARAEWAAGGPGPVVHSPEGAVPPYALTVGKTHVDFRLGEQTGRLPTAVLVALAVEPQLQ